MSDAAHYAVSPILIVQTGAPPSRVIAERGDYARLIQQSSGLAAGAFFTVNVALREPLPRIDLARAVIVTGSSAMVSDALDWSERTARWLQSAIEASIPTLGICFGHQLIAHALGGRIGRNPLGREIGSVQINLNDEGMDDALFAGLSNPFYSQASHRETVLELPKGARLLASNTRDRVQAYAYGHTTWGVQFHPELDASSISQYIEGRHDQLVEEGFNPDALLRHTRDDPAGSQLLRNFVTLATDYRGGM